MPILFVDLAQTCAPMVAVETLAAVVSLESRFQPYSIRIQDGQPLPNQPTTKAEAIAMATSLIAERQDIHIGLGGIGGDELARLNLSIADGFEPCLNLQATGTLLDGYYRLAVRAGAELTRAERIMLQSYYGRNDPSTEAMTNYDRQVAKEAERLSKTLSTLTIGEGGDASLPPDTQTDIEPASTSNTETEDPAQEKTSSWDVFNRERTSSVLVFQNNVQELSE
jgi:type IV secretion system protein VirB1